MNTNQQSISGVSSKLTPFRAIADDADFVVVQPGAIFNPYPTFQVHFGKVTPAIAAVPAVAAIPQKSGPNLPDYVAAVPAVPEVPAVPSTFLPHRGEALVLTQDEWDNWDKSVTDEAYILSIVAKRFGVSLIVPV